MYFKRTQNNGICLKTCYEKGCNILARKITRHDFWAVLITQDVIVLITRKKTLLKPKLLSNDPP